MDIWVVDVSNQLFLRGTKTEKSEISEITEIYFEKSKVVTGKTPLSVIGAFCSQHSICHNIGFSRFEWK